MQENQDTIKLIGYNLQTKKFEISPEAKEFLEKIEGPIAVVSSAGVARIGKSSFNNRVLLKQKIGF